MVGSPPFFLPFHATERSVFALQIVKPREFDDVFQLSDNNVWQIYPAQLNDGSLSKKSINRRLEAKTEVLSNIFLQIIRLAKS